LALRRATSSPRHRMAMRPRRAVDLDMKRQDYCSLVSLFIWTMFYANIVIGLACTLRVSLNASVIVIPAYYFAIFRLCCRCHLADEAMGNQHQQSSISSHHDSVLAHYSHWFIGSCFQVAPCGKSPIPAEEGAGFRMHTNVMIQLLHGHSPVDTAPS